MGFSCIFQQVLKSFFQKFENWSFPGTISKYILFQNSDNFQLKFDKICKPFLPLGLILTNTRSSLTRRRIFWSVWNGKVSGSSGMERVFRHTRAVVVKPVAIGFRPISCSIVNHGCSWIGNTTLLGWTFCQKMCQNNYFSNIWKYKFLFIKIFFFFWQSWEKIVKKLHFKLFEIVFWNFFENILEK